MTHYWTLGVERDADPAIIKRAYRKLAQRHHPDRKGGDQETFQRITKAYETLSDPERRAHYDQYGEDPTPKANAEDALVMQVLSQTLAQVMDSSDVKFDNILQRACDGIKGGMEQVRQLRRRVQKDIDKCEQALGRLEDAEGMISDLLRARLQGKQKEMADAEQSTRVGERVLGLLVKARYRTDDPATRPTQGLGPQYYAPGDLKELLEMANKAFRY